MLDLPIYFLLAFSFFVPKIFDPLFGFPPLRPPSILRSLEFWLIARVVRELEVVVDHIVRIVSSVWE
jgi:hypothetical protein